MKFKHLSVSLESALTHVMAVKGACQGAAKLPLSEEEAAALGMLAQDLLLTAQWLQHDFAEAFVDARSAPEPNPPVVQERLDQIDLLIRSSRRIQTAVTWVLAALALATVGIIAAGVFHHVGTCLP